MSPTELIHFIIGIFVGVEITTVFFIIEVRKTTLLKHYGDKSKCQS